MALLNEDWLTQGLIDTEYKKYILLGYIKEVKSNFEHKRLYPFLSDLVFHYNNLHRLKENKKLLYQNFPREISKADFEKLQIHYRQIIGDDHLMQVIEEIVNFSMPHFKASLNTGTCLYEEIAQAISIEPIGIAPLFKQEGYLLLCTEGSRQVNVYRYKVTVFDRSEEKYRGIHTELIEITEKSLTNSYEHIKVNLIKRYQMMPNPATFLAHTKMTCPLNETLLPVTKRLLVQHLEHAA